MVVIFDSNCQKMPAYQIAHFNVLMMTLLKTTFLTHQMENNYLVRFHHKGTFAKAVIEIDDLQVG